MDDYPRGLRYRPDFVDQFSPSENRQRVAGLPLEPQEPTSPKRHKAAMMRSKNHTIICTFIEGAVIRDLPTISKGRDGVLMVLVPSLHIKAEPVTLEESVDLIKQADAMVTAIVALLRSGSDPERCLQIRAWWHDELSALAALAGCDLVVVP
jgi:hypothetical protein